MKAILEIDMPEKCIGCPCESEGVCQALDTLSPINLNKRRDDCPLKAVEVRSGDK